MKKHYLHILLALIGIAGLGTVAKAQEVDHIVVTIPYAFVVSGETLPAGTYTLMRESKSDPRVLFLNNFEEHASTIVVPTTIESNYATKSEVSFEQIGGQLFLSKIQTGDHLFTIPVSRAEILEAAAKSHSGTSGSGSGSGSATGSK